MIKKEGRIVGVEAEDKGREPVEAAAKAVIVATGGYCDNPKMIKKFSG